MKNGKHRLSRVLSTGAVLGALLVVAAGCGGGSGSSSDGTTITSSTEKAAASKPKPVATGKSTAASTTITFAPVRTKFVRFTETDVVDNGPNWAMTNMRLFEAGAAPAK